MQNYVGKRIIKVGVYCYQFMMLVVCDQLFPVEIIKKGLSRPPKCPACDGHDPMTILKLFRTTAILGFITAQLGVYHHTHVLH